MKNTQKRTGFDAIHRRKSPSRKKWLIILSIFIGVLFGVYHFFIHRIDRYIPLIESTLSKKLDKTVSVGSMTLRLLQSSSVNFSDISIVDPKTQQTLFTAEKLRCYFSLSDILRSKKLHFTTISVISPTIRISDKTNFLTENGFNTEIDNQEKYRVISASLLNGMENFSFDSALSPPDRIVIVDGSLEFTTKLGRDSLLVNNLSVLIDHLEKTETYGLFLEGTQQGIQDSRIYLEGTVSLPTLLESPAPDGKVDLRIGLEKIDATPFLRSSSPYLEQIDKLNISGTLTGHITDKLLFIGTLNLPDLFKSEQTEVYIQSSWNRKNNTVYADNVLLSLFDTVFTLDGYYDLSQKAGDFYLVSKRLSLAKLQSVLPPVKKYSVKADTHLSTHVRFAGKRKSYEGSLLFYNFLAQFDELAYPLAADIPFFVNFTKNSVQLPESSFSFGPSPFLLQLRLDIQPEKQLFININECRDLPLLGIFNATSVVIPPQTPPTQPQNSQTAETSNTLAPPASSTPLPIDSFPIYMSGLLKKPTLGKAQLDSVFFDTLIEGDRILFKDLDIALYGGSFRGNGIMQLHPTTPYYSFVADFENIDINALLSDTSSFKDMFWGTFQSAFSFQTQGTDTQTTADSLRSQGMLKIKDGKIANINFMREILNTFSTASDDNKFTILGQSFDITIPSPEEFDFDNETRFHTLNCDFTIKPNDEGNNAFHTNSLKILSAKTNFNMRGNFDFEKNLDFTGDVTLSRMQTERLMHKVKEFSYVFNVDDDRMNIPFRMSGTFEQPRVIPIIKMENAQNVFENILQEKLLNRQPADSSDASATEYQLNLSEKDLKRIEKFKKKLDKYLGE